MQEKTLWNHLWEHRFYVPDPRVFPPPDDHFVTPTTENPFYDWACRAASNKKARESRFLEIIIVLRYKKIEKKCITMFEEKGSNYMINLLIDIYY